MSDTPIYNSSETPEPQSKDKSSNEPAVVKGRSLNLGRLFTGGFILLFGLFYLFRALGWLEWGMVVSWDTLWPLIIIAIGLSLIRVRGFFSIVVGIIGTLLLIGIAFGMVVAAHNDIKPLGLEVRNESRSDGESNSTTTIAIPKQASATKAIVSLKAGAGKFRIYGKESSEGMVSGTINSSFSSLRSSSRFEGTIQRVELEQNVRGFSLDRGTRNEIDLGLANDIPLDFTAEVGASNTTLDFTDVIAENINLSAGASSLNVILGNKATFTKLDISAGASSLKLRLPADVGVRLKVDSALSSRDMADLKRLDDGSYESENYAAAAKKVEITLHVGVSSLDIER